VVADGWQVAASGSATSMAAQLYIVFSIGKHRFLRKKTVFSML
jgi:hypothetical protein